MKQHFAEPTKPKKKPSQNMQFFNFFSLFLFVCFLFLLIKWKNSNSKTKRLPPGPWKLPLIGSMFHLLGGLPHQVLRDLAKKYGPIMHLQLGEVSLVVVTSPDMAKQVLNTQDISFASRPKLLVGEILFYKGTDIVFSPIEITGDKCISIGKLLKDKNKLMELVKEASRLMEGFNVADLFPSLKLLHVLCGMKGKIMDAHHALDAILENIINEHKNNGELEGEGLLIALLRLMKEGGFQFPITNNNIKAIIFVNMFSGGTETSSTLIDWAMVEMMRNPSVLLKLLMKLMQKKLKYLKLVVKETFKLHPPGPLLIARECREEVDINGYIIPLKTKVMVNAWAIGRDPKYWIDVECFKPERFEQISIDFIGNSFEFLPFGSGRRICPGISFGLANIIFPLAKLLYHFDWKLPIGINPSDLDLTESAGITYARKSNLYLIATPHQPCQE
ncbi:hypothetical protein H5410_000697 [Solanum commersonii]|uniref:Cytochrome P450 n=1 Tax=Solanum commersonii TaxID=4109 RepID=A0A9J6AWZ1_SOLCO|nr:hypothetical protein H5410_000697 [Solanum commersonii]